MDQNIKDTEFEEVITEDKQIRGVALYFSTSQVAARLGITDSKVRYYTNVFDDILHIEISNKQRRYTESDIDKMRYLVELKDEGLTIKQIQEYCSEVDFENGQEITLKESNPLSIKNIAKALMEEQRAQLQEFKKELFIEISNEFKKQISGMQIANEQMRDEIVENVAVTVDEIVSNKLQAQEDKLVNELKNRLDQHKAQSEQQQQQEKKGFFKKIFG